MTSAKYAEVKHGEVSIIFILENKGDSAFCVVSGNKRSSETAVLCLCPITHPQRRQVFFITGVAGHTSHLVLQATGYICSFLTLSIIIRPFLYIVFIVGAEVSSLDETVILS